MDEDSGTEANSALEDRPPSFSARLTRVASDEILLVLEGDLDVEAYPVLVGAAGAALATKVRVLTLDLGGLDFTDSSGYRAIDRVAREAAEQHTVLVVRRPSPFVAEIMSIVDLNASVIIENPLGSWPSPDIEA